METKSQQCLECILDPGASTLTKSRHLVGLHDLSSFYARSCCVIGSFMNMNMNNYVDDTCFPQKDAPSNAASHVSLRSICAIE